jgi:hypothetical protein
MTITLEKIKGMNIPVGTPIEIIRNTSINSNLEKNPNNKFYRELGYFQGIRNSRHHNFGEIIYAPILSSGGIENTSEDNGCMIPYIEEIKVLEYKK